MKLVLLPTRPAHYKQGFGIVELGFAAAVGITAWLANAYQRAKNNDIQILDESGAVNWSHFTDPHLQISAILGANLFFATCSLLFYTRYDSFRLTSTVPLLTGRLAKLFIAVLCLILILGHLDEFDSPDDGDWTWFRTHKAYVAVLMGVMPTVVGLLETAHDYWIARAFDRTYFRYKAEAKLYRYAAYFNLALFAAALVMTGLAFISRNREGDWLAALRDARAFFFISLGITGLDIIVLCVVRAILALQQRKETRRV